MMKMKENMEYSRILQEMFLSFDPATLSACAHARYEHLSRLLSSRCQPPKPPPVSSTSFPAAPRSSVTSRLLPHVFRSDAFVYLPVPTGICYCGKSTSYMTFDIYHQAPSGESPRAVSVMGLRLKPGSRIGCLCL